VRAEIIPAVPGATVALVDGNADIRFQPDAPARTEATLELEAGGVVRRVYVFFISE
jgi:hypothetical protein